MEELCVLASASRFCYWPGACKPGLDLVSGVSEILAFFRTPVGQGGEFSFIWGDNYTGTHLEMDSDGGCLEGVRDVMEEPWAE